MARISRDRASRRQAASEPQVNRGILLYRGRPAEDTDLNRSTVYVSEPFPARFKSGTELTDDDLTNPREPWQMRAKLCTELLSEICLHSYEVRYHMKAGDTLNQEHKWIAYDSLSRTSRKHPTICNAHT